MWTGLAALIFLEPLYRFWYGLSDPILLSLPRRRHGEAHRSLGLPRRRTPGHAAGSLEEHIVLKNGAQTHPLVVSVVVPLYNEERNVPMFADRLAAVFKGLDCAWELVFALDPSPDRTREKILELIREGLPIRLITFSRRIGKPLSLLAGLDHARGDVSVVMDVDLQDPPELIEQMLEKWREGFKVVIARRTSRQGEHFLYLKAAELFYVILERFAEVKVPRNTGDFRLLDARVVREVCRFRERHGFLRGITAAAGFPTTIVPFDRDPRLEGRTQIPLLGAVNIALDGIVPFSRTPVRMIFLAGIALFSAGALGGLVWLVTSVLSGFSPQWPIVLLTVLVTVLSGVTLTALGTIGEYLVRTYEEARDRPLYIVDEITESETLSRKIVEQPDPRTSTEMP